MAQEHTTRRRPCKRDQEEEDGDDDHTAAPSAVVEEEDRRQHGGDKKGRHQPQSQSSMPAAAATTSRNALAFWTYLIVFITLLTLLLSSLHSFLHLPYDDSTWFLSLPSDLRLHYSSGRFLKDHHHHQSHIFTLDLGPKDAQTVILLHGLVASSFSFRRVAASLSDRGLRAVALDLPGSGFSDVLPGVAPDGVLFRVLGAYKDLKEKGIFWAFDQLVEKGFVEYEDKDPGLQWNSPYAPEKVGSVVGRAIEDLSLKHVHLVLHDSAMALGMHWALRNEEKVRSITFIDSSLDSTTAFPLGILAVPVVREVVLGFRPVFKGLLRLCCSRGIDAAAAEAYRMMLKGKSGQWGVVEHGKRLNFSLDLGEWAALEEVQSLPKLVLWSHAWTDSWIEEGRKVSIALGNAKFVQHFGGRWPQEDAAEVIADELAEFVLSIPKPKREMDEHDPEVIQNSLDEAGKGSSHQHHGSVEDQDLNGHDHEHMTGFMDAYPGWRI